MCQHLGLCLNLLTGVITRFPNALFLINIFFVSMKLGAL